MVALKLSLLGACALIAHVSGQGFGGGGDGGGDGRGGGGGDGRGGGGGGGGGGQRACRDRNPWSCAMPGDDDFGSRWGCQPPCAWDRQPPCSYAARGGGGFVCVSPSPTTVTTPASTPSAPTTPASSGSAASTPTTSAAAATPTKSAAATPASSGSAASTPTTSVAASQSSSAASTRSKTAASTPSTSAAVTKSPAGSAAATRSAAASATPAVTGTPASTKSPTGSTAPSAASTPRATASKTPTAAVTQTPSSTAASTRTRTRTAASTRSRTATASISATPTASAPTISYVFGTVFDSVTDAPLVGVPVSSPVADTVTDVNGSFAGLLLYTPLDLTTATFTVNACGGATACISGYPSTTAAVSLHVGVAYYTKNVFLNALEHHAFTHADGLPPLNVSDNAAVEVPPAGPGGNTTGIFLRVAVVPPHAGPGALRSKDRGPVTGSDMLQSLFMAYIDVVDEFGKAVTNVTPTIKLRNTTFPNEVHPNATDALQWWFFDTDLGVWVPEAAAPGGFGRRLSLDAGTVAAQAAGYWNSDRNILTACTLVHVVNSAGAPCVGATATASGVDGIVTTGVVNSVGDVCVDGPSDIWIWGAPDNFPSTIVVGDASGSIVFPSNPGSCSTNRAACNVNVVQLVVTDGVTCPVQPSSTRTPSGSFSSSASASESVTSSPSASLSSGATPSRTITSTRTPPVTKTSTPSRTPSASSTVSGTATPSNTGSSSTTPSNPPSPSVTPSSSASVGVFYGPAGVQTNVPVASLNGWTQCFSDDYADPAYPSITGIETVCCGESIMLACRATGSDTLTVAAWAPRNDVLYYTGTSNTPHNANGVGWYFSPDWSWGFAPEGDAISRNSCDTYYTDETKRLCWHTGAGNGGPSDTLAPGWSCGTAHYLQSAAGSFQRVVYTTRVAGSPCPSVSSSRSPTMTPSNTRSSSTTPSNTPSSSNTASQTSSPSTTPSSSATAFPSGCLAASSLTSALTHPAATGVPSQCSASSYYNGCSFAPYGFSWRDVNAAGLVQAATLTFAAGVECAPSLRTIALNGVTIGTYYPSSFCSCAAPYSLTYTTVALPAAAYRVGGDNVVSITGANSCAGFYAAPGLGGGFSLLNVTVLALNAALCSPSSTSTTSPTASLSVGASPSTTPSSSGSATVTTTSTASGTAAATTTPSGSGSPSTTASPSATSGTPSPSATKPLLQLAGSFTVNQGPYWGNNPPTYTCIAACALLFGAPPPARRAVVGPPSPSPAPVTWACSTVADHVNHQAWVDGYGDTQFCSNNPVADTFSKSVNYDCGFTSCSYSAYVSDHGCNSRNYCFKGTFPSASSTVSPTASPSLTSSASASLTQAGNT